MGEVGRSQGGGPVAVFSGGGTGGHLYPALALAGALAELRPDLRTVFVGAERGIEARVLPARGVEHLLVPVEGLRRGAVLANLAVLAALGRALRRVGGLFHRLRPSLVVVTGGYAGGPAGLVAGIMGIRLVLQEQNSVPGLTTRLLSLWAREVHLAFPEAVEHLPRPSRGRARISGNPVRAPEPVSPEEAAHRLGLAPKGPVILVVGGSQGSEALNRALLEAVGSVLAAEREHPAGMQLLWATGPTHLPRVRGELEERSGGRWPGWLHLRGYLEEMPLALGLTTLAVSRAGAMATSEFLAWGIPAILVPFPHAAADHQTRNARALAEAGAAICIPESELEPGDLWDRIVSLLADAEALAQMRAAARTRGRPRAAREIAASLERHLPGSAP